MAAQSGQDQGADKNSYYMLWLIALIVIIAAGIWYLFSEPLKQFFIIVKLSELTLIYYVLRSFAWMGELPWVGNLISTAVITAKGVLEASKVLTPDLLSLEIANHLGVTTGEFLRYPTVVYLLLLTLFTFRHNVQLKLKKTYNMKSLAAQEQVNWPQIKIATKHDIVSQDLDSGPWAMAMSPIQFAKKNKLVTVTFAERTQSQFAKAQGPEYKVTLDRVRAERAFSVQLGRPWQGFAAMPAYRRAILAIFAARGGRDTPAALALVAQLACTGAEGELDCTGADELWKKHASLKRVQEICAGHAYEFTVFISMLLFAREDGVVASADFLWVKPIDRRLWYVLNNVGRQTPSVEVGGIVCHWYYEMALKRPLHAARVEGAVLALDLALSELLYIPGDVEKEEILKRQVEVDS